MTESREREVEFSVEFLQIQVDDVSQFNILEVIPCLLRWIKVWGICREGFHIDLTGGNLFSRGAQASVDEIGLSSERFALQGCCCQVFPPSFDLARSVPRTHTTCWSLVPTKPSVAVCGDQEAPPSTVERVCPGGGSYMLIQPCVGLANTMRNTST